MQNLVVVAVVKSRALYYRSSYDPGHDAIFSVIVNCSSLKFVEGHFGRIIQQRWVQPFMNLDTALILCTRLKESCQEDLTT